MNEAVALPINKDVIQMKVVDGKLSRKNSVKYNKDGSISKVSNHKKAGVSSEVYCFKTESEISSIIQVLDKHIENAQTDEQVQIAHRNKLLFLIGMNIGIRASDLRTLRWNFFLNDDGSFKQMYILQPKKQKKQGKFVKLFFNNTIRSAIKDYLEMYPVQDYNEYMFASRKGNDPIVVQSLCKIIKDTAIEAGITQNIGSHSLRKTWGYWCWHQAEDKNKALVILQQCFAHSSTQVTMRYIGLQDEELESMYYSVELGLNFG